MAVKRAKAKVEEEVFYVGISDPISLRRSVLESSKVSIQLLKSYEILKEIRVGKIALMAEFDREMNVLNRLITKLKSSLPKTKFKETAVKAKITPVRGSKTVLTKEQALQKINVAPTPQRHPELDKLESELGDIESKMRSLR